MLAPFLLLGFESAADTLTIPRLKKKLLMPPLKGETLAWAIPQGSALTLVCPTRWYFEPDIGTDAPDAVSSFKVLPGSVTVQGVVDRGYLWLKEFPRRWLIVLLCYFSFLLCNMDHVNMSISILPMSREFNWSPATVGLVQSSFFWGYLLTQIAGGIWADKVGGKRVLGLGVVLWSIATILTPITVRITSAFLVYNIKARARCS